MTGYSRSEALDREGDSILNLLDKESRKPLAFTPFRRFLDGEKNDPYPTGVYLKSRSGETTLVKGHISRVRNGEGEVMGYIGNFSDVGSYDSLMEQLNHLQKQEAIGQLASGVAHDLNNMLGGVMGAAELMELELGTLEDPRPFHEMIDIIHLAIENARELTDNLLLFGRKGSIASVPVDVGEVAEKSASIAKRTIDKLITIKMELDPEKLIVRGDSTQLQNALLNLILNARDAQPRGGLIEIRAGKRLLTREYCQDSPFPLTEGEYVDISICDKGTGLGLATVESTVRSHKGAIEIYNCKEGGCCFHLLFPRSEGGVGGNGGDGAKGILPGVSVLIIDDEKNIRTTTSRILEDRGFRCVSAESGSAGLEYLNSHPREIDIILLDVAMPGMGVRKSNVRSIAFIPNCRFCLFPDSTGAGIFPRGFPASSESPLTGKSCSGPLLLF